MLKIRIAILIFLLGACIFLTYLLFEKKENGNTLTLYGNVDVRLVDIGFRVPGQVAELFFEEGDYVKEGDLIATLDPSPYDAKLAQAEAAFQAIQVQLANAEILLARRLELIGIGGVSQEDLDNAYAKRDTLQAELFLAKAAIDVAKDNLRYTKTYAPTEGVILTRIREGGSVVNASDPVYTVSIATPIWVRAYVDETHLGAIAYGMPAYVYTDFAKGFAYSGKIGFISPMAEFTPKTVQTTQLRTDLVYRLRIYVDNPDQVLKQGMPVTVKIPLQKKRMP